MVSLKPTFLIRITSLKCHSVSTKTPNLIGWWDAVNLFVCFVKYFVQFRPNGCEEAIGAALATSECEFARDVPIAFGRKGNTKSL